jgi:DNA-binding NarL/FixJ family response regulator
MGNTTRAAAPIRALVLDDHDPSRLGLGLLLQREAWVERVLLAKTQDRAVALTRRHRQHVAVVDVSNLGLLVAPVLDAVREAHRDMRIVLSSRCPTASAISLHNPQQPQSCRPPRASPWS